MILFYWITTGLLAALMGLGAVTDLLRMPEAEALFRHLGYPFWEQPSCWV